MNKYTFFILRNSLHLNHQLRKVNYRGNIARLKFYDKSSNQVYIQIILNHLSRYLLDFVLFSIINIFLTGKTSDSYNVDRYDYTHMYT